MNFSSKSISRGFVLSKGYVNLRNNSQKHLKFTEVLPVVVVFDRGSVCFILFDDDVDRLKKGKMVAKLPKDNPPFHGKRYVPSKKGFCSPLYDEIMR